jgi:16S rRNA (adenine1518-N6/adenine1519-N6)-dimethyltransferase
MAKAVKLGQNFLHDKNIAAKIINAFLPQPGPVLEIGSGPGILSELLLEKIPASLITLVEIDRFLAEGLRQRFGSQLQILEKDILDVDLTQLFPQGQHKSSDSTGGGSDLSVPKGQHKLSAYPGGSDLSVPKGQHKLSAYPGGSDLSVPKGQVAIIGNLPYHISKRLIDWFIGQRTKISAAVLMLQKDFVDKLLSLAGGKRYNAQSVVFQLLFQARRCFNVPAGAFTPAPKINSTVLAIRPVESPLQAAAAEFYPFVKLCFAERRKTLWNNLAPHFEKQVLSAAAAACGLSEQTRAEQLSADHFLAFFIAIKKSGADRQR